ncbi:Protein of unknown function, DUF547 [Mesonia phycicola]|uniref:DUF547 domain-containing protein n=1 Tax=Mesonia phycicola TaxID=579105 RepID=A0A1M6D504_9FLAO|nr:DUF547 domain-containing protein [Mesonia phycicola]SHI68365.1 Protein of unknown function, DUF547 [Mesonia phycicola]
MFNNYLKSILTVVVISHVSLLMACTDVKQKEKLTTTANYIQENVDAFKLAENFYFAVKNGENAQTYITQLENITKDNLESQLQTNDQKKAFWINIYNTYVQYLLTKNPELYEDRSNFFTEERFTIAGKKLSLDDVEHGIIRDSSVKLSMGHLKDPFASKFEKKFRVSEKDWRVHFALNCGAKSCPPVAFYKSETINEQLEKSSKTYLTKVVNYKKEVGKVYVPKLMDWFRGDFGGKDGAIKILKNYQFIPESADPEVEFLDYNWELDLKNYI